MELFICKASIKSISSINKKQSITREMLTVETKLILFLILLSPEIFCQYPADSSFLNADKTIYDFGTIYEADGNIDISLNLIKKGKTEIKIRKIYAPGFNTVKWPKDSILSNQENPVLFQLNPFGKSGYFSKPIYIFSNAKNSPTILTIKGKIISGSYSNNYKHCIGKLALKQSQLNFGYLYKNTEATRFLPVYNNSDSPITVKFDSIPPFMEIQTRFDTLKCYETGIIEVRYDTKKCMEWDFVLNKIAVKVFSNDTVKGILTVTSNIREDFTNISEEDKINQPIAFFPEKVYNFDTIQEGEKVTYNYLVKNNGKREFIIRAVKPTCGCTAAMPEKTVVAPGESSYIRLIFDSNGYRGHNKKGVTVITNDPVNYKQFLWITGFISDSM